jgi:hypothetical protein
MNKQLRFAETGTMTLVTGEIFYDVKIVEATNTHVRIEQRHRTHTDRRTIHRANVREFR